jgi:prepilin-type N-terminal cleavage/methylation domain-containing protein
MSSKTIRFGYGQSGLTLIEVTIVIAVLLMLTSVLFLGASAYKRGSDRALCIQSISTVQKAVRSYANLNALSTGESVANLKDQIIAPDGFITTEPACRGGGTYTFGGDVIPLSGVVYMSCSITDHVPSSPGSW